MIHFLLVHRRGIQHARPCKFHIPKLSCLTCLIRPRSRLSMGNLVCDLKALRQRDAVPDFNSPYTAPGHTQYLQHCQTHYAIASSLLCLTFHPHLDANAKGPAQQHRLQLTAFWPIPSALQHSGQSNRCIKGRTKLKDCACDTSIACFPASFLSPYPCAFGREFSLDSL